MKYILISLSLLCTTTVLTAQQQNTVKETENEHKYLFRVVLEAGSSKELMHCMNNAAGNNINVRMKGDLTSNIDEHSTMRIVTRDRVLTIEHDGNDPEERERTKAKAAEVKACLGLPETLDTDQRI